MGLLVLLIGSWVPDDRLNLSGIPIDLSIMFAAALLATTGTIRLGTLRSIALLQAPIWLLGITLFWSTDPTIGLDKLTTLLISGNIGFILLNTVVERHGADELAKLLMIYLGMLLLAAIPYKLAFGFFDRRVNFFINGPIVFARLMCIAALLSLFYLEGKKRVLAVILFSLAIVWTESKGPILSIALTFIAVAVIYAAPPARKKFYWYFSAFVVLIVFVANYIDFTVSDLGRLGALYSAVTGDIDAFENYANRGSFGARFEMWTKTIALIPEVPFGIGLGAWDSAVETRLPTPYPHNLFLELWSEGGFILGSFASIPFLAFLFAPKRMFWFIALCLFIAQMVSGDIGDGRFLLVFGLLSCFSRREGGEEKQPLVIRSDPLQVQVARP